MFFEKKGAELIGKSAETLRKQYEPSTIPPEISQWIGHKFTFIVKVLSKKSAQSIDPSFEVLLIKERHGKQATLPTIRYKTSISCNTDTTEHNDLPPLITIPSKRKSTEASSSQVTQYADIKDMDIDRQSFAWDQTESHNNTDDEEDDENKTKKLKRHE